MTRSGAIACAIAVALGAAGRAAAEPPAGAAVLDVASAELPDLLDRLRGQRVAVAADRRSISIEDIAGDGPPWVGVIERRGDALWLLTRTGALRLAGALARPRIAGPGYTVWAIGRLDGDGVLVLRRIGVLRRP